MVGLAVQLPRPYATATSTRCLVEMLTPLLERPSLFSLRQARTSEHTDPLMYIECLH
jgi:hypothetical protein